MCDNDRDHTCFKNGCIYLYGDIEMEVAVEVGGLMDELSKLTDPIVIKINSAGGDLYAAQSIMTEILRSPGETVADITGMAMSSAAMIALCCDRIKITNTGVMMLHYPNWETDNQSLIEHKDDLVQIEAHFEAVMKNVLKRTKFDWKKWKKAVDKKHNLYFTATEAKKLGLVHEIY